MNATKDKLIVNKKRERKRKNLIRPGVIPADALRWSRTRLGGWAIAQSPILNTTITIEVLGKRGYESMIDWYRKKVPHKFIPTLFSFAELVRCPRFLLFNSLSRAYPGKPPYTACPAPYGREDPYIQSHFAGYGGPDTFLYRDR